MLIVEDDPVAAASFRRIVSRWSTPVIAPTLSAAREALADDGWEAFLVDVWLPDGSGLEMIPEIRKRDPHPLIVVMTAGEIDVSGARSLLEQTMLVWKPFPEGWLDAFTTLVLSRRGPAAELAGRLGALGLSAREIEVFGELATGARAEDVARRLHVSVATVRSHCARVYESLGTSSLAEVIALAFSWKR